MFPCWSWGRGSSLVYRLINLCHWSICFPLYWVRKCNLGDKNLKVTFSKLTSFIHLFLCTFSDIAAIPLVGNLSGNSLIPLMSIFTHFLKKQRPDWVFSEYHGCNVNASTYMLRSGRWKYISYSDGTSVPPQLFGEHWLFMHLYHQKWQNYSFLYLSFADLEVDKEELNNVAEKFQDVTNYLDNTLRVILDYPKVSEAVHHYNKKAFTAWRESLGGNYSQVIANLRWHVDWQKDVFYNEEAINTWLQGIEWFRVRSLKCCSFLLSGRVQILFFLCVKNTSVVSWWW